MKVKVLELDPKKQYVFNFASNRLGITSMEEVVELHKALVKGRKSGVIVLFGDELELIELKKITKRKKKSGK